ncbi:MAG TPA: hypothetical protein VFI24_02985 [Pyrinomonadaceae bacterium]|nr:hypothetical protein [Pyrinomonadaceae bacterium]
MPKEDQSKPAGGEESKQPFVSPEDRPEVRINLDTPLSELRVRELSAILGSLIGKNPFEVGKTPIKDFFDKPFPETTKDFVKESKPEIFDKAAKFEKPVKFEKGEIKEIKAEKVEVDGVFDPGTPVGPDPRLDQLIQTVTGLTKQVGQLANQVEELRKKVKG